MGDRETYVVNLGAELKWSIETLDGAGLGIGIEDIYGHMTNLGWEIVKIMETDIATRFMIEVVQFNNMSNSECGSSNCGWDG